MITWKRFKCLIGRHNIIEWTVDGWCGWYCVRDGCHHSKSESVKEIWEEILDG